MDDLKAECDEMEDCKSIEGSGDSINILDGYESMDPHWFCSAGYEDLTDDESGWMHVYVSVESDPGIYNLL